MPGDSVRVEVGEDPAATLKLVGLKTKFVVDRQEGRKLVDSCTWPVYPLRLVTVTVTVVLVLNHIPIELGLTETE